MDDLPPIEIIPFGRTEEQQAKIDAQKARGLRGLKLLCLEIIAVCFVALVACLHGLTFR